MRKPRLQVLICTVASRIGGIDTSGYPVIDGVEYRVCCQNPDGFDISGAIEALEARPDIKVNVFADKGLSINRNHAFDIATAPYVHVADDDICFHREGLERVLADFEADPSLDIITTRSEMPEPRVFPPDGHDLATVFRYYHTISFEISLRRSALQTHRIRFSPLAGIGAPFVTAGEEELLMHHMLKAGMKGRFADVVLSVHPGLTTSAHSGAKAGVVRAKGAVMRIVRGTVAAFVRYPVEALRSPAPTHKAFLWLLQGFFYSIRHRHQL